jgi:hypothetical protein
VVRFSRKPREEKGGENDGRCLSPGSNGAQPSLYSKGNEAIDQGFHFQIHRPTITARGTWPPSTLGKFQGSGATWHAMDDGSQCSSGPVQSDSGWWVLLAVPSCSLDLVRIDCIACRRGQHSCVSDLSTAVGLRLSGTLDRLDQTQQAAAVLTMCLPAHNLSGVWLHGWDEIISFVSW